MGFGRLLDLKKLGVLVAVLQGKQNLMIVLL